MSYVELIKTNAKKELENKEGRLHSKFNAFVTLIEQKEFNYVQEQLENNETIFDNKDYLLKLFRKIIKQKDTSLINYMLNHPKVDPDVNNGKMLIHAVNTRDVDVLTLFINHEKINTFSRNMKAYRMAEESCWDEGIKLFEEKMKGKKLTDHEKREILITYIQSENFEKFKFFVENNSVDLDFTKATGGLLRLAVNNVKDIRFVKYILNETNVDVNEKQGAVLVRAVETKNIEVLEELFNKSDLNVNIRDGKIIRLAVEKRNEYAVEKILEREVNLTKNIHKLIPVLLRSSNNTILSMLLEYNNDVINYLEEYLKETEEDFWEELLTIKNYDFLSKLLISEKIKDFVLNKISKNSKYFFECFEHRKHEIVEHIEKNERYSKDYFEMINNPKIEFVYEILKSQNMTGRNKYLEKDYFQEMLKKLSNENPNFVYDNLIKEQMYINSNNIKLIKELLFNKNLNFKITFEQIESYKGKQQEVITLLEQIRLQKQLEIF